MRKKLFHFLTIIILIAILIISNKLVTRDSNLLNKKDEGEYLKAKVIEIIDKREENLSYDESYGQKDITITFKAQVISREKKGEIVEVVQNITGIYSLQAIQVKSSDKVIISPNDITGQESTWVYIEHLRSDAIIILAGIFILLILIYGRFRGINTLLSLILTIAVIFFVFVPSILTGFNPYIISVLTCIYIIISTLLIVYGANKKSLATGFGCLAGIIVSCILVLVMNKVLNITGIVNEESVFLLYLDVDFTINLKAIVFASVIIGAIGAIMDVAVDISSSLSEVASKIEKPTFKELFNSGMNIGRDIMGSMSNTLILAYIGSSLSTVVLLTAYNSSMLNLFNREMIIIEILQALIGSIGLLFAIPFTSMIASLLYAKNKKITIMDYYENND